MEFNKFLFEPVNPKIGHGWDGQDQVVSIYVHAADQ